MINPASGHTPDKPPDKLVVTVYLGLGSNMGDRQANCLKALDLIECRDVHVLARSGLYETKPWGVADQPDFVNMCVEARTCLSPRKLLATLKSIEEAIGRTATYRWGPRVIDIDILFYGSLTINRGDLVIPHPHLHERDFVLRPLADIAADFIHPGLNKSIRDLLGG